MNVNELKANYPKEKYEKWATHFMPEKIKYLLIAESPPHKLTKDGDARYFYFKDITERDALLINTVKGIHQVEKYRGKDKEKCLNQLQIDGFFLIDAVEYPIDHLKERAERNQHIKDNFPVLNEKIEKLKENRRIDAGTKIILIKRNVFRILKPLLEERGLNVINKYILPFPSFGNQKRYQKELKELIGIKE